MSHVFVSYARKDLDFVMRLVGDLRAAKISIWLDREKIIPGEFWDKVIIEGLEQSDATLVVLSQNSITSHYVFAESLRAAGLQKPIFVIIVDDVNVYDHNNFPAILKEARYLDAHLDYNDMISKLLAALPKSVRQEQPDTRQQFKSKGYVFISYCEEDTEFAVSLREFLKVREYAYWDYQDSDRDYHSQLFIELERAISQAAATLAVLSPDWKRSKWTPKEYLFSEDVGIPVFLLMAREMGPALVTAGIPYIDFTKDQQKGFDKLDRELRRKGLI
jgi:hypothetical protein